MSRRLAAGRFRGRSIALPIWVFAFLMTAHAFASGVAEAPLLAFAAGRYDFNDRDEEAIDLRVEYRWGRGFGILKPWAGLEVTSDEAAYGVAGLLLDFEPAEYRRITPGIGVGAYRDGEGKDLGHTIQFRIQIELAYRLAKYSRLAVAFSHLSNVGLGDRNPGTQVVSFYYTMPLGSRMSPPVDACRVGRSTDP